MTVAQSSIDKLLEGDVFQFAVETFSGTVPVPLLATLMFGTVGLAYYIVQRSVAIPMVMFIMIGGSTIALAPTRVQQSAVALAVVVIAGLGYVLLNRVRV
jgi:hypothetical protein